MILLSMFSDIVYKDRKKINLVWNRSYESKLSQVVKSIEKWVTDALRGEKNDKMFHCNSKTQIISEICEI